MAQGSAKEREAEGLTWQSEDYLEAIAILQKEERVARAKDIADRLGVTRGTVTSALKGLQEKGLINYQPYSYITLTDQGKKLAEDIIHRHDTLTLYFEKVLHLPARQAEANACRAEHVLDAEVIDRMVCFLRFLDECPRTSEVWQHAFDKFCVKGSGKSDCKECVGQCLAGLYGDES